MDCGSPNASSGIQRKLVVSPSTFRCIKCNARNKESTRNLVVCIDGTSNQFGPNNTNVVKLFAKIDLESTHPEQFSYYSSVSGASPEPPHTFSRMRRAVHDKFGMTDVRDITKNIRDAYSWLVQMYREGDQIYLFGFSRGAYQVQVLAGMIHEVGLMREMTTEDQVGKVYDCYEAICQKKPRASQNASEFRSTFCWQGVRIHFIGVWDTISYRGSVDVILSTSAGHACHFRHALALDELRVKFNPRYFHEINTLRNVSASRRCSDVKEVWFAGSHSDVGGKSKPGEFRNAGNVSLLWMRREVTASGLILKPTDTVWLPDDIDYGISNLMTRLWRAVEYFPVKHRVSFGGASEDAGHLHRLQPRRIIPGQKIHASILYAIAYQPKASFGDGFDIPMTHYGVDDMELDDRIWETGLFDDTVAQELLASLGSWSGVAPIYLDRLLFMLRFREGKQCVRSVPDWQAMFMRVITNLRYPPLVRLVAIVAYHDASCDTDAISNGCTILPSDVPQNMFLDAEECLVVSLANHRHQDGPTVVALLRPLTKHPFLQQHILSVNTLEALMNLSDVVIRQPTENFGWVMDGLNCLLHCVATRQSIVEKLGVKLSRVLEVDDTRSLTAALRVTLTLAQIPEARAMCIVVKPRVKELATIREGLVGQLAAEISLVLYDPSVQNQLNVYDKRVRANLASALVQLNLGEHDSAYSKGRLVGLRQHILYHLFGLDARELSGPQKKLVRGLKKAVEKGNIRERAAATMTLLRLCESAMTRNYLHEINMLDLFVRQMRRKDNALLAAYALARCMKYNMDIESVDDNRNLPKYIVGMLNLNYFDDAVGQVEGFQIFRELMQHLDLRERVVNYGIIDVLGTKLGKGEPKETRTGLICLDIFRSLDSADSLTRELVNNGLQKLSNSEWKTQEVGVMILYALAQTEDGVASISPRIPEIVEMLLPAGYLPIRPTRTAATASLTLPNEGESQIDPTESLSATSRDMPPRPPSWMMGPACALRTLAQNETLRDRTREIIQYRYLKDLFLSGALVDKKDTPAWRIRTARRADVINMLYKMIMAVDDGPFEHGLMSLRDAVPPHIRHSSRLVALLRDRSVAVVAVLTTLLGVPVLAILTALVYTPTGASIRVYRFLRRVVSRYQGRRALHGRASEGGQRGETLPRGREEIPQGTRV